MIVGTSLASFDTIRLLNISRYRFYLTGSRFFGYAKPDSDWDFFTQDKEGLRDYLLSKGFTRLSMNPEWLSSNTLAIWNNKIAQVQVSIERDWQLKNDAQEFILHSEDDYLRKLRSYPKQENKQVWEEVFRIVSPSELK